MSLFKKPKKLALRVFTIENENEKIEDMVVDESPEVNSRSETKEKKKDKKDKTLSKPQKSSLLSFGGDEEDEEGEMFQVKKSSYSRKIHKERTKKHRSNEKSHKNSTSNDSQVSNRGSSKDPSPPYATNISTTAKESNYIKEIQSDDGFSIRLKNSNPENLILNGRAALCAGKNEMSSEGEEVDETDRNYDGGHHRFSQPDDIKIKLEAGTIPDAAMIHAARKRRQKAREQGEFIALEEKESDEQARKGKRNVREEDGEGSSEEERVDMSAITGVKEREERREQFYSVQSDGSENDGSDVEMNEWENQQIRKGVTGTQLLTAKQESAFSHYMIPSNNNKTEIIKPQLTTAELLEQAYSQTNYEIAKHIRKEKKKETVKSSGIKTPQEILNMIREKLKISRELNHKHYLDIDRISEEFKSIKIDLKECSENGPKAAAKYRYYQEFKLYVEDLVECLNEKVPIINALEERALTVTSKYSKMLIERRRQDVRDQAKEITDLKTVKKSIEDEERIRRAAEREGRRTRRRRNREKLGMNENHNEGMSSDEEVPDIELSQYRESLAQIKQEASLVFEDVSEEYFQLPLVLQKFEEWKRKELNAYKESFFHLCLPKIVVIFIRWQLIMWNPFEKSEDIEKMEWFHPLAMYGKADNETEESLRNDADVFLIPTVIEKVIIPKLNKIIEGCFDPLSTTQTLKLVKLLNQMSHEYPSLRITSKNLQNMFTIISEKMKLALDNDVFIPIFQKQQNADARSSFFQRQFFSGIKLFRNFISFQGIIADAVLKSLAISSLLNRYLLSAMRVSLPNEGISKALTVVLTLPRVWLITADKNFIDSMNLFVMYVSTLEGQLDRKNPSYADAIERLKQILGRLDLMVH